MAESQQPKPTPRPGVLTSRSGWMPAAAVKIIAAMSVRR